MTSSKKREKREPAQPQKSNGKPRKKVSYDYSGAGYWIAQNSKVLFAYVGFQSLLLIVYEAVFNTPLQVERLMIMGVPLLIMAAMRNLAKDSAKPGLIATYHSWTTILLAATGVAIGYLYKSDFHLSVLLLGIGSLIIMAGLSCYFWSWYVVNLIWLCALLAWTIGPWFQIAENRPVLFQTLAVIFISAVFCRTRVNEFKTQISQSSMWSDHRMELQAAVNSAKESTNRFQKIYEGSFEGIVLHKAGYIFDCNPSLLEIFQVSKEEIINQNIMKLLKQEGNTELMNSLMIGESQSREILTTNKYGETLYLEVLSKLMQSDDGDTVATALRNVTQRKLAEEEIYAKNQALEKQFDRQKALAEWSTVIDRQQDIQDLAGMILRYLSELLPAKAGVYFGIRSSRNSAYRVFVVRNGRIEPETWAADKSRPLRGLADEVCREKITITKAPESLGLQKRAFAAIPLDLSAGREGFIIVQDMDMDHYTNQDLDFLTSVATRFALGLENKKMVEDLVEAKEAAEAGSRAKSQFLATLSHELRTPLNGIIGSCQILEPSLKDDDDLSTLETVRNSSENMINMVDRILSFTQVEGGKTNFNSVDFSIETLLLDVSDSLEALKKSRKLYLRINQSPDMESTWNSDYQSCKSILLNLVENGLKYTDEGGVDVDVAAIDRQGKHFLHIEVRDTGHGFPGDREEELFKPFTQAEGAHSRKYGGLGLGLAVCKALVHKLGGRIGIRPSSVGSIFWVEIPDGIPSTMKQTSSDTEFYARPQLEDADSPAQNPRVGDLTKTRSSRVEEKPENSPESAEPAVKSAAPAGADGGCSRALVLETSPVMRMGLMRHFDKTNIEADFCKSIDELLEKYSDAILQSNAYKEVLFSEKFEDVDINQAVESILNLSDKFIPSFKKMSRARNEKGKPGSGLKLEKISTSHRQNA